VYKILLKHTTAVQPISCDEAYLDVTGLSDPLQIAAAIRAEVTRASSNCYWLVSQLSVTATMSS
jgi:DNA repair protein REV1